ncbi:MAG: lipopolysaccharide assembly protein LapA domain-containing protein [Gammaproteobacteria bacterium]|nr:DUF1049 domain-containing protein [Pseudomonadales bacterium]
MTKNSKLISILLLSAVVLLFIFQNVATVEIQFLFWSMSMPRSLMILLILLVGILIGWFLRSYLRYRRNRA